jgi:hypothetical protein
LEASPAEEISFDAASDLSPRFKSRCPGFDGRDTLLNLGGPLARGICIGGTVQTREEFGGQLSASLVVEAQGFGQDGGDCLGHDEFILRFNRPPNKRLHPTVGHDRPRVCASVRPATHGSSRWFAQATPVAYS